VSRRSELYRAGTATQRRGYIAGVANPGYSILKIRANSQHNAKHELVAKVRKKSPKARGRRWSAQVTKRSDALDLESDVFKGKDPHRIALSLKRSAERSKRRKATSYQSAMSMLNFYINRAGKNLPQNQKRILERAKDELRDVFDRA
jgi:hypothetical protein